MAFVAGSHRFLTGVAALLISAMPSQNVEVHCP